MSNNDIHLIDGPEAWHGKDLVNDERWRLCLDDGDIVEIDRALQNVKERGLAWSDMTRGSDFPLDRVLEKLAFVSDELEEGCGLINIKGFPVDRYEGEDINRIWYGIALNIGTPIY